MPAYWVTVNGENFLVEIGGTIGKYGFFTHRRISAGSPEEAGELAVRIVLEDQCLLALVRNQTEDRPITRVETITETTESDCPESFVWYQMNPKRWWQFWKR
jgi:hypothetical protein